MRRALLVLAGLCAGFAASQQRSNAQTALLWKSTNSSYVDSATQDQYEYGEIWLEKLDLSTGTAQTVEGSKVFTDKSHYKYIGGGGYSTDKWRHPNFLGRVDKASTHLSGDKVIYKVWSSDCNGVCDESLASWNYFDTTSKQYFSVNGDGDLIGGGIPSIPTDLLPAGAQPTLDYTKTYLVGVTGSATANDGNSSDSNVTFTENGIAVNNSNMIRKNSDGSISVGANSVSFGDEPLGAQSMWATDQNGIVDINITKGTDLKINGKSVQGQIDENKSAIRKNKKAIDANRTNINNLGDGIAASTALGAALSALPVTPDDAPFSCGVGSGAYSSRFAMGLGCVAKLNQRLSLNAGGSHVFGGSSNYGGGSLDSAAWRGGFVLKLGKLDSPAATNEQLQSKVKELEERNAAVDAKYSAIQEENAAMKAKHSTIEEQNAVITQQNKALMARLERLEAIALGQQPATTTASLK